MEKVSNFFVFSPFYYRKSDVIIDLLLASHQTYHTISKYFISYIKKFKIKGNIENVLLFFQYVQK